MLAFFPQLSKPEKVAIPERYVELEPEEPLSTEELAARQRKAEKIKNILTKSRSVFSFFRKSYIEAGVGRWELTSYNSLIPIELSKYNFWLLENAHRIFVVCLNSFLKQGRRDNDNFFICPFSCSEHPKIVVSPYQATCS